MTHGLNAPGTKRLKLNYDKLLSSFAFSFNLRHYNLESKEGASASGDGLNAQVDQLRVALSTAKEAHRSQKETAHAEHKRALEAAEATAAEWQATSSAKRDALASKVGRCRLTASQLVFKAPYRFQHLQLESHKLLSMFAFGFNLRRYTKLQTAEESLKEQRAKSAKLEWDMSVLTSKLQMEESRAQAKQSEAGGSLRTSSRPTLNRLIESVRLYEHSP